MAQAARQRLCNAHTWTHRLAEMLELSGVTGLSGEEERTFFELLPGVSYTPVERIEIRFGVRFPLFKPTRLDTQYIFTFSRVF